jgi:hypothetical protein
MSAKKGIGVKVEKKEILCKKPCNKKGPSQGMAAYIY